MRYLITVLFLGCQPAYEIHIDPECPAEVAVKVEEAVSVINEGYAEHVDPHQTAIEILPRDQDNNGDGDGYDAILCPAGDPPTPNIRGSGQRRRRRPPVGQHPPGYYTAPHRDA